MSAGLLVITRCRCDVLERYQSSAAMLCLVLASLTSLCLSSSTCGLLHMRMMSAGLLVTTHALWCLDANSAMRFVVRLVKDILCPLMSAGLQVTT